VNSLRKLLRQHWSAVSEANAERGKETLLANVLAPEKPRQEKPPLAIA
jgi:hypothetical protein